MRAPIPQRIAPLAWREPAFLWTPLALIVAVGWPTVLFYNDPGPQRLALVVALGVFAAAMASLGVFWALGRPPRSRRVVVLHVLAAGMAAALIAPFLLSELLALVTDAREPGAETSFSFVLALTMAPLTLVIILPMALISGAAFAWIALTRSRIGEGTLMEFHTSTVQPFR